MSAAPSPRRAALWAQLCLALLALFSAALPGMHYRFIEGNLNGVRYSWGLLPAEYAIFQALGRLSGWLPWIFMAAILYSFFRPDSTRKLLRVGTILLMVFAVAYACVAILIVAILLANRTP